jgi:hypothetical protein
LLPLGSSSSLYQELVSSFGGRFGVAGIRRGERLGGADTTASSTRAAAAQRWPMRA